MREMEWSREEFTISTNNDSLDLEMITKFLAEESYWANRRSREQSKTAIENSLCFGLYTHGQQVGFARVISDFATFAYVGDVFILNEFRGQGLGVWLMEVIVGHPELQGLRRWVLATKDAHDLYAKFGFSELKYPDRWMELCAPDAYK